MIVMATYNGSAYLASQLRSIQAQSVREWTLLVRDDGSVDHTPAILAQFASHDSRIEMVTDDEMRVGPAESFARLAALACARGADRVVFADQDDVWHPNKVERHLQAMAHAEGEAPDGTPILVHSDLEVVDGEGRVVQPSFMRYQRLRHRENAPLSTLLVQNFVTGCTMTVNAPLLDFALPMPKEIIMHDWWLALCAAAAGRLVFDPMASVSYRRHASNTVAVRGFWNTMNPARTSWRQVWRTGVLNHRRALLQAKALLQRTVVQSGSLTDARRVTKAFVELHAPEVPPTLRVLRAAGLRLSTGSLPRTVVLYLRLMRWSG